MSSGRATGGVGGSIGIVVGDGDSGLGGDLLLRSGGLHSEIGDSKTGGNMLLISGRSLSSTSGLVKVSTANAGAKGVSGSIGLYTGTSSAGDTGSISIGTEAAEEGKSGSIE